VGRVRLTRGTKRLDIGAWHADDPACGLLKRGGNPGNSDAVWPSGQTPNQYEIDKGRASSSASAP